MEKLENKEEKNVDSNHGEIPFVLALVLYWSCFVVLFVFVKGMMFDESMIGQNQKLLSYRLTQELNAELLKIKPDDEIKDYFYVGNSTVKISCERSGCKVSGLEEDVLIAIDSKSLYEKILRVTNSALEKKFKEYKNFDSYYQSKAND